MSEKKTILIVDDHPLFREGVKSLLAKQFRYQIVGEGANGAEGLRKAMELRPDVVIMDITLPDTSGIEITRKLRASLADTRIVMLSVHLKVDYIAQAVRAGAKGYVAKESAMERLTECIETVLKGDYFIDPLVTREVAEDLLASSERRAKADDRGYGTLSPREREVLCLIAEGFTCKEIGKKLFISPRTVENHRYNVMNKLGLHSTVELVRYAFKFGLVDTKPWNG